MAGLTPSGERPRTVASRFGGTGTRRDTTAMTHASGVRTAPRKGADPEGCTGPTATSVDDDGAVSHRPAGS